MLYVSGCNVVFINKISRLTFFSLVGEYKAGTYLKNQRAMRIIGYKRVPHFRMEFSAPIAVCIDGEIMGAKNIDFQVVRNAFNFVIPRGSKLIDDTAENQTEEAN